MIDFIATLRKIHNKLPELDIDTLLNIMDCITVLPIIKHPDEDKMFNDFMNYNKI